MPTLTHLHPKQHIIYWLYIIILGLLTPLTFAPYYLYWLMPLLFAALIWLIHTRPHQAVRTAYLFGLTAYSIQFYWIHTALHDISGLPNLYAIPLTLLLPSFLALYPAACFWLWEKFTLPLWLKTGLLLPTIWTLTEFARERLLTGFGWGALGYSQATPNSWLAGFAPLGGIHLLTFITALSGALIALALLPKLSKRSRLTTISIILALQATGFWLKQHPFTHPDGSTATVALAQGNIPQQLKWQPEQAAPTIQRYYEQVAHSHADIVILPETAIPQMRQHLPEGLLAQFANRAQINGSALAVGIAQYTPDFNGYENAVINLTNFNPDTPDNIPSYSKNHLVPFGEYKPLPMLTEPLYRLMNMPLADFQPGGEGQKPFLMANQNIAFNICYEDGFGDELIASAKQSSLLANISNMAWYGDSNAMYQQLQQSQARALELGRYMVRATNNGVTAVITPNGSIQAQLPPNIDGVLESTIKGYTGLTPYMRIGSSCPFILILISIATIAAIWQYRTQKKTLKTSLN